MSTTSPHPPSLHPLLPLRLVAIAALFALLAAACGSPNGDTSTPVAIDAAPSATEPATDPPAEATPADASSGEAPTVPAEPQATTDAASPPASSSESESPAPTATAEPAAPTPTAIDYPTGIVPTRITIDAIGIDAEVIELDLRGPEPEVPTDFADVGWYTATRLPGELGPAVLAGHIDSRTGPAVFARLDELAEGDTVTVEDADGETRSFVVTGAGQYPKTELPDEVFGVRGSDADLRLITCGGSFDTGSGHYEDNYVVYASAIDA